MNAEKALLEATTTVTPTLTKELLPDSLYTLER